LSPAQHCNCKELRNSSNINGSATNFTISINYASISFVYVDATAGWRSVDTSNIQNVANQFVLATGGTITTSGDYNSIINGYYNINRGKYNNIFNGANNNISGTYSTIINGKNIETYQREHKITS
jgi:hypothetical protein